MSDEQRTESHTGPSLQPNAGPIAERSFGRHRKGKGDGVSIPLPTKREMKRLLAILVAAGAAGVGVAVGVQYLPHSSAPTPQTSSSAPGQNGQGQQNGRPNSTPSPNAPSITDLSNIGWASGASGDAATEGTFCKWRTNGQDPRPCAAIGVWADDGEEIQRSQATLGELDFHGARIIDLAPAGLIDGESYAMVAEGNEHILSRWKEAAAHVMDAWYKRDPEGKTQLAIRPFHEFTGNFAGPIFAQKGQEENFKEAFRVFVEIQREAEKEAAQKRQQPQRRALMVLCANGDTSDGGASVEDLWPGDDVVDVYAVDFYDQYPTITSEEVWNELLDKTKNNSPWGLNTHYELAQRHGKPIALPEWGLHSGDKGAENTDNPLFIKLMHKWMREHNVLYDVYYDINADANAQVSDDTTNPKAAKMMQSLPWGTVFANGAPITHGEPAAAGISR